MKNAEKKLVPIFLSAIFLVFLLALLKTPGYGSDDYLTLPVNNTLEKPGVLQIPFAGINTIISGKHFPQSFSFSYTYLSVDNWLVFSKADFFPLRKPRLFKALPVRILYHIINIHAP